MYKKRVQAQVRSKFGNDGKIVTSDDYDHPENIKAAADWDNNKVPLVGSCPAYDIALEARFVEESDSRNLIYWP